MTALDRHIMADRAKAAIGRVTTPLRARRRERPFTGASRRRLLLIGMAERIARSQTHPFHHYAGALGAAYDLELRETTPERYFAGQTTGLEDATTVCFQSHFDITDDDLHRQVAMLRRDHPRAKIVYLDWFAPTDLRLAARIDPLVDLYVKKHLLRDRDLYGTETRGDTNLTDHFSRAFGLDLPLVLFGIAGQEARHTGVRRHRCRSRRRRVSVDIPDEVVPRRWSVAQPASPRGSSQSSSSGRGRAGRADGERGPGEHRSPV